MVDRLLKEKDDEVKKKDFCVDQLNKNSRETADKNRLKADLEAKIGELQAKVAALAKDIEVIETTMADLSTQLKIAGEDREKANKDFQVTIADQRATQKLLGTALAILKGFYEKAAGAQAPPPGFSAYKKNEQSGGVMGMMQGIIDDAKAMEAEAIRAEEDAQKSYEDFTVDTNNALEALKKDHAAKTRAKGKTEAEQLEEEVELDHTNLALEQLATENQDIHKNCDFLLRNYEVRTAARDQEIEALKQAIAVFSGAKMAALLQHIG